MQTRHHIHICRVSGIGQQWDEVKIGVHALLLICTIERNHCKRRGASDVSDLHHRFPIFGTSANIIELRDINLFDDPEVSMKYARGKTTPSGTGNSFKSGGIDASEGSAAVKSAVPRMERIRAR